ncbi:MAG: DUF2877 domain-containing protein [Acidimicrobiia bacterium]|nr:DUF2877 domain-containing protein [Acidimicrobiia bacterium]
MPGDRAAGRCGRLRVGGLHLDARHAAVWRPPWPRPGPVARRLPGELLRSSGQSCRRLLPAVRRLRSSIEDDRPEAAGAALRSLIGAGPGLTPSGDDAVVGLVAALQRAGTPEQVSAPLGRLRSLVPPLLPRTTTVSGHYLRLALNGHIGEHLAGLVDACVADRRSHGPLVERVLRAGATSGADALVGVAVGLEMIIAHRGHERCDGSAPAGRGRAPLALEHDFGHVA